MADRFGEGLYAVAQGAPRRGEQAEADGVGGVLAGPGGRLGWVHAGQLGGVGGQGVGRKAQAGQDGPADEDAGIVDAVDGDGRSEIGDYAGVTEAVVGGDGCTETIHADAVGVGQIGLDGQRQIAPNHEGVDAESIVSGGLERFAGGRIDACGDQLLGLGHLLPQFGQRRAQFAELTANAQEPGWGFAFEMAINAQLLGYRLGEVPAISVDRMFGGTSTFQLVPWVIDYLKIYALGIRRLPPRPFARKPEVRVRIPGNIAGPQG